MAEQRVETDVELVRGAIERFAAVGGEAIGNSWEPDIEFDMRPTGFPGWGLYRGREATKAFLSDWVGSFGTYEIELEEVRDAGDGRVLAVAVQRGRASGSEAEVAMRFAQVYTVREGRIARVETFLDVDEARRAASG
jgi:ketosteroid isomerase-like protein